MVRGGGSKGSGPKQLAPDFSLPSLPLLWQYGLGQHKVRLSKPSEPWHLLSPQLPSHSSSAFYAARLLLRQPDGLDPGCSPSLKPEAALPGPPTAHLSLADIRAVVHRGPSVTGGCPTCPIVNLLILLQGKFQFLGEQALLPNLPSNN